ncbi:MAG: hypothetical protein JWR60_1465 [Polaromonas sp.]|nr:hypothetical protein [Polaromonas sp.]
MNHPIPQATTTAIKGKLVCPCCSELATRVTRKLHDRVFNMFKPIKRYHCDYCDWTGTIVNTDSQRN